MAEKKKKASAKKKLIPAVAMLATSAVMLSSATYAWFTLNKDVQVTGLTMSATAGDSLEISLGEITSGAPTNTAPSYDSISWKREIPISNYYKSVGKLKPASSDTGLTMYKVDDKKVFGGGTKVENGAIVDDPKQSGSASLNLQSDSPETYKVDTENGSEGYYIDVPMWIRSTNAAANEKVYCSVTISSPTDGSGVQTGATNDGTELMKAVRVAIIPIGTAQSKFDGTEDNIKSNLVLTGSAGYTADTASTLTFIDNDTVKGGLTNPVIFGLTNETYTAGSKVLSNTDVAGNYSTPSATQTVATSATSSDPYVKDTTTNTAVFTIPKATGDNFSGVSFIARVWIEGESKYCNDATADQDWNIDFHFTLDEVPATPAP